MNSPFMAFAFFLYLVSRGLHNVERIMHRTLNHLPVQDRRPKLMYQYEKECLFSHACASLCLCAHGLAASTEKL